MLMIVMVVMMIIMVGKIWRREGGVIRDKLFCKVNGRWFCSCRWG